MNVTIHQPEYMPWLGFFHKIKMADVYVVLDNVQYRHRYFQNRNKIKSSSGELWLNVPVLRKGKGFQLIKDVAIDNTETRWMEKNNRRISINYKKAPYFTKYAKYFEYLHTREWRLLVDLNMDIIQNCLKFLHIETKVVRASELGIEEQGEQLILDICKALHADIYISGKVGIAAKGRTFETKFNEQGIEVIYQEFCHPRYKQLWGSFTPYLSIVDLLFNYGEKSLDVIKGGDQ